MSRRDIEKVTAYVEPEVKAALKRLAQDRGTTVAAEAKRAIRGLLASSGRTPKP